MKTKHVFPILISTIALASCAPAQGPTPEELKANTTVVFNEADAVRPVAAISTEANASLNEDATASEYADTAEDHEINVSDEERSVLEDGELTSSTYKGKKSAKTGKRKSSVDLSRMTVAELSGGKAPLSMNTATRFPPASITKLVTSGIALEKLGREFRFKHVFSFQPVTGAPGVVTNFKWVSDGDPTLGHPHFESGPNSQLKAMIQGLKAKGVRKIIGPITLEAMDARFEGFFLPQGIESWEPAICYGAPARDFNINRNCQSSQAEKGRSISNPKAVLQATFLKLLKADGITLQDTTPSNSLGAEQTLAFQSPPISRIIYHMNKPSDNLLAGALFRAIAAHDEDKKSEPLTIGQRVYKESTTEWMTSLKVPVLASEINLYDGAGLSAESNTTARAFIEVLKHLAAQPYFATIWDSLPIGGVDGTISSRYKNPAVRGKVRAKTGTMGGHYQLAGYIPRTGADGKSVKELIPFVILTTTPPTKAYQAAARAYQEGIVLNLARQINGK